MGVRIRTGTKNAPDESTNQSMTFEEYGEAVATIVLSTLKKSLGKKFRGWCTDTLKGSYDAGETVERAADIAIMDTEYWELS